jgi:hypothetical protein
MRRPVIFGDQGGTFQSFANIARFAEDYSVPNKDGATSRAKESLKESFDSFSIIGPNGLWHRIVL